MSNPYRDYKGMVYVAGTVAVGTDRYGDATVYRGDRSKDSEVPTLDVQSTLMMWREAYESLDAKLDELEAIAKRLALDLECMILDPVSWRNSSFQSLQDYQDMMDRWYPQEHVSPLGKD